ncbi:coiled-coil domain-containing protein 159 isoform X2 [Erinaceus europaeus]|uniref:Coiled-coil domain-containing protein 159 isoform X2 n=1 Tax=Erinaceus europaeus TaxID=9365 RepID=A0ABM3WMF7_ERIEU|nr:coiled-coil domain-containing protein 159 isoform X2 [Erinaceus europaeus]
MSHRSDPLLAGLSRDSECSGPCICSPPQVTSMNLTASGSCGDKCWGSHSNKVLEYKIHWSRSPESENLTLGSPENATPSAEWRPGRSPGSRANGAPPFSTPDVPEGCSDQDLLRKTGCINKNLRLQEPTALTAVWNPQAGMGWNGLQPRDTCAPTPLDLSPQKSLETNPPKVKAKPCIMVPDSQKHLRCELESLRSQLQAQTKAFEFLNHSVTMLEKESCLQQIKIQQLEEMLSAPGHPSEKEGCKWKPEQGQQELYGALAEGLQGLQKTLRDSEEVQRARTTRCLQLLAQEIRDSKKFLWEELELVREEVAFIYRKLQAQEEEITENLVSIQKLQKTQVKCRKVLAKMKRQGIDTSSNWLEEEPAQAVLNCWREDLRRELGDIWSAVHTLQNSFDGLTVPHGTRPRASSLRGDSGHRCLSPVLHSWDSDSDEDQDPAPVPLSRSRAFPVV